MTTQSRDNVHANRTRLGKLLEKYNGRILAGIRMNIDKSSAQPSRYRYRFIKLDDEPVVICEDFNYRPPGWEDILRSKQPQGWERVIEEQHKEEERKKAKRKEGASTSKPPSGAD